MQKKIVLKKDEVLVWKRCTKDNVAYNEFVYPKEGFIEATDWNPINECGQGLHGWTKGYESYFGKNLAGNFVVMIVDKKDGYIELDDKVKFRKGKIILNTSDIKKAHDLILSVYPDAILHWSTTNQGNHGTTNQGDWSTTNQGHWSTTNQGRWSTANQGYESTANQGDGSTANQGDGSIANQGDESTTNQGYNSTTNQGYWSTANQGNWSTANQRNESTTNQGGWSTTNQGDNSTTNQGNESTTNQGDNSIAICHGADFIYRGLENSFCVLFYKNKRYLFTDFLPKETIYIKDCKVVKKYLSTPDLVDNLEPHEVFVFGSNKAGNHIGGAAKLAVDKFGAILGQGEGLQGQSYAFPTLDQDLKQLNTSELEKSVQNLLNCAYKETRKIFLVTKVGCGIAGFTEDYMINLFQKFKGKISANVILPAGWY